METVHHFEEIIKNPNLQHLVEEILEKIDAQSLGDCRLVSKDLKYIVDNAKSLIILQIRQVFLKKELKMKELYQDKYVHFQKRVKMYQTDIETKLQTSEIQSVFGMLKVWGRPAIPYKDINYFIKMSPFQFACFFNEYEIVELFLNRGIAVLQDIITWQETKHSAFHHACQNGSYEVVNTIMNFAIQNYPNFDLNFKNAF